MEWLKPGTLIDGRFRIIERLPWGGQSIGYRAEDIAPLSSGASGRPIAIFLKQYLDITPAQLGRLDLLFQEIAKRLTSHTERICIPVSASAIEYRPAVGVAGNAPYASYPWVSGKTLAKVLRNPVQEGEKIRLLFTLLKCLRLLSNAGIAHLDLNPANVMVQGAQGRSVVRLIDFDMAKVGDYGLREVGGTENYMSPEHYGGVVSCASDVFSLGILMAEILFAQHPFRAATDYEAAVRQGAFELPAGGYHPQVLIMIRRSLAPDPSARPTAGEIVNELNKFHGTSLRLLKASVVISGTYAAHYYEDSSFGSQEMRGLGVPGLTHAAVLSLRIDPEGGIYSLTLLEPRVSVSFNGWPMRPHVPYYLGALERLLVVNGVRLMIRLEPL